LTETGLLGLGLFLALNALWARDAWALWRSNCAPLPFRQMGLLLLAAEGVYFLNGMFHDVSVVSMANMTLFFLAGINAGLRPEIQKDEMGRALVARRKKTPAETEAVTASSDPLA
jgi:O-antigen ligase